MYPSVRDYPSLSIHVEFQPLGHEIGFGIGESDVARCKQYTGQSLDGHVISRQTQRPLIDHHRAIGFVGFSLL
jgi:hypothetical protein